MKSWRTAHAAALLLVAGCARTQLAVSVGSDLADGGLRIITVQARGPAGVGGTASATLGAHGVVLPVTVGLVAEGDLSAPVTITAVGLNDGMIELVRQDVRARFAPGATRTVRLSLDGACVNRFCHAPSETCVAGCCVATDAALDAIASGDAGAACPPRAIVDAIPADQRTCVRRLDGSVQCWGTETSGDLPIAVGDAGMRVVGPTPGTLANVEELALGLKFGCARLIQDQVQCWGANYYGQAGQTPSGMDMPVAAQPAMIAASRGIATGRFHFCAILANTIECLGAYDPSLTPQNAPQRGAVLQLAVPNAVQLAAGDAFTCARLASGGVACWGGDDAGQLGNGDGTSDAPAAVAGITDAVDLAAGSAHACVARADGSAWCWGQNANGQLGDGTTTPRTAPVRVAGLAHVSSIAAGADFTCAVASDAGSPGVYCWGNGAQGQLGDGLASRAMPPGAPLATVPGALRVAAGPAHACAVTQSGTALCWGANANGEITGTTAAGASLPPTAVPPP